MEPHPAEQLVAPPQGQMDQAVGGAGTTDVSPSPLARLHAQCLDNHGEVGGEAQVRRRVSNLSIHPELASVLLVDELRRGSQVQCHPVGLCDHRAL